MTTDTEIIKKDCDKCGAVFELGSEKEKSVRKRQKKFPDIADILKQELICCDECAVLRIIELL